MSAALPPPMSDADREAVFRSLPDMLEGFMKTWGWLHFAKGIESSRDAQWQAYAQQARADLEAENKRLREALQEMTDDYADRFDLESPSTNPGIKYVINQARAALKEQP